jgi:hypothetical protein
MKCRFEVFCADSLWRLFSAGNRRMPRAAYAAHVGQLFALLDRLCSDGRQRGCPIRMSFRKCRRFQCSFLQHILLSV